MELKTWLNQERGRAAALASFLELTPGRITQIADDGVPKRYMLRVRDFTGNAVTLECMASTKPTTPKEVSHG